MRLLWCFEDAKPAEIILVLHGGALAPLDIIVHMMRFYMRANALARMT